MKKSNIFTNVILGSTSSLFLLALFQTLSRGNWLLSEGMVIYYALLLAGALFYAFVLLRCSSEFKLNMSLLTISLVLSIYALELFLSYTPGTMGIKQNHVNTSKNEGVPFDSRAPIQVTLDLREEGIDAYGLLNPVSNMDLEAGDIFPLGYISGKTTVNCNESGEYVIYESDEHGFNNPSGLYAPHTLDAVLIGDSFTQGACVKREADISGLLRGKGFNVLNLGMINSGPLNQLAILKEYAKPLNPKKVFWVFYEGNDFEGLLFEKKFPILLKYLDMDFSQDLIGKQEKIDDMYVKDFLRTKKNIPLLKEAAKTNVTKKQSATFDISLSSLKLEKLQKRVGLDESCRYMDEPLLMDIFREAKQTVSGWGGTLHFVYLPAWDRYPDKKNYCRNRFLNTARGTVLSVINEQQIPVIDIQEEFDNHPDPLSMFPFRIKGHYNEKGYKLVADQLDKSLSLNRKLQ